MRHYECFVSSQYVSDQSSANCSNNSHYNGKGQPMGVVMPSFARTLDAKHGCTQSIHVKDITINLRMRKK